MTSGRDGELLGHFEYVKDDSDNAERKGRYKQHENILVMYKVKQRTPPLRTDKTIHNQELLSINCCS